MVIYLFCVTPCGIPLLERVVGGNIHDKPPFSKIASLHAAQTYLETTKVTYLAAKTPDSITIMRNYNEKCRDKLKIILILKHTSFPMLMIEYVLHLIEKTILTFVGLNAVGNSRLIQIQRILKPHGLMIDRILNMFDGIDVLYSVEVYSPIDCTTFLQETLESWTASLDFKIGWLMVDGKLLHASSGYWKLHSDDRKILSLLLDFPSKGRTFPEVMVHIVVDGQLRPFKLLSVSLMQRVWLKALSVPHNRNVANLGNNTNFFWSSQQPTMFEITSRVSELNEIFKEPDKSGLLGVAIVNVPFAKHVLAVNPDVIKYGISIDECGKIMRKHFNRYNSLGIDSPDSITMQEYYETAVYLLAILQGKFHTFVFVFAPNFRNMVHEFSKNRAITIVAIALLCKNLEKFLR